MYNFRLNDGEERAKLTAMSLHTLKLLTSHLT